MEIFAKTQGCNLNPFSVCQSREGKEGGRLAAFSPAAKTDQKIRGKAGKIGPNVIKNSGGGILATPILLDFTDGRARNSSVRKVKENCREFGLNLMVFFIL